MKFSSFENLRDIAGQIQDNTEGQPINNALGTNVVNEPMDGSGLSEYNKGVDVMINYGNYHVFDLKK